MSESEHGSQIERRILTCLVLDVVGSTDLLAVQLGPDQLKGELSQLFAATRTIVESAGGIIEKFLGDGLLAIFGIPHSHEDDPQRALRAALDCVHGARESRSRGGHLAIRVAVETGDALVNVGALGRDQEHGIVGLCVNLASRLQAEAPAGGVLVGPACHQLVADLAEFESVGPFDLKGLDRVPGWRLVRLLEAHTTVRPAFVGRRAELEALHRAFERARTGHPTIVLVIGPPGQGKSRLTEEFVEAIRSQVEVLAARCRPDDERGSENPFRQLLAQNGTSPSVPVLGSKLEPLLPAAEERGRTARALAHSAGIELDPGLLAVRVSTRESVFVRAWSEYLDALAHRRPVLVHVEDLQWAEPGFTRLLARLAEQRSSRLMVVATARPEVLGGVALRPSPNLIELNLGPLDPNAAIELGRSVGADDPISLERAQGNPLYLLELARSADHAGPVPLTIQSAIGVHLDALAPDDRSLLGSASVVGEEFRAGEVACVADRPPADVSASLGRLAHLRYIASAEGRFRFHHRLVRDVAYGRLSAETRLRRHAQFAREGLSEDEVEAIAHHWWVALGSPESEWVWRDDPDRPTFGHEAFRAQLSSARRHIERAASERALEVAARAVRLATGAEETGEAEWLVGDIRSFRGEGDEAWSAWRRILEVYRTAGLTPALKVYVRMVRHACWIWGTFRQRPNPEEVVGLIDEGCRVARASGDILALANLLVCRRGFLGSAPGLEAALDAANSTTNLDELGETLVNLATVQSLEGDLAAALATCDRVDQLTRRGAKVDEHQALLWRFMAFYHAGDLDSAERIAERAAVLARGQSPHYQSHSLGMLSWVAVARARWTEVATLAAETEKLVTDNPSLGFCLVGAGAVAWGSVGDILRGGELSESLEPLLHRMVPESGPIRASILFLPSAMIGLDRWLADAAGAYRSSTQFWDRQEWDQFGVNLAIGLTVLERWDGLGPYLQNLERGAAHGGRLCAAIRDAVGEEEAGSRGGPAPRHQALHGLGYGGLSELLSFRPKG
jgi:class 3 adenylate cyclase